MPWSNQGGPWGGGQGPWGRGSGGQPPNLEDLLRQGQDRFKRFVPKGAGGPRAILYILVGGLLLWLASGIYRVQPDEQGIVMRFGGWIATTDPGLHYHLPTPIEWVITPKVERINSIDIGFRALGETGRGPKRDVPEESLMLTGDQNIIDIDVSVLWKVNDAGKFLFNIREPELTVKTAAESALREIIGRIDIQPALTEARRAIESDTRILLQSILDTYGSGIEITQVQLQEVHPPTAVTDAFNDVQRALQDRDRLQNEADAYRNDVLPRARGDAVKQVQDASAYREKVINEAEGNAQRFLSVYKEYKQAKDVTLKRIYLETLEDIFRGTRKVIVGGASEGGFGVAPYLPIPLPMPPEPGRGAAGAAKDTNP